MSAPIFLTHFLWFSTILTPSTKLDPKYPSMHPEIILRRVDFPLPFGPTTPTTELEMLSSGISKTVFLFMILRKFLTEIELILLHLFS